MNILAIDTATPATAVAVAVDSGATVELRDEPPPGSRGEHAARVLVLAADALAQAQLDWAELDLVAVGLGPGGYTGLRIALATARGLARAHGSALAGVGTLRALAEPLTGATAIAVLDARRSELFLAAYRDDVEMLAPRVIKPDELADVVAQLGSAQLCAIGDGALAQRAALEALGVRVPAQDSPLHYVSAAAICRIAARSWAADAPRELTPLYLRRPDAELAVRAR